MSSSWVQSRLVPEGAHKKERECECLTFAEINAQISFRQKEHTPPKQRGPSTWGRHCQVREMFLEFLPPLLVHHSGLASVDGVGRMTN